MSIIEKALDLMGEKTPEDKPGTVENIPNSDEALTEKNKASDFNQKNIGKCSKSINIDLDVLEYKGYLTPNSKNKVLFEQYRRIKLPVLNKAFENRKATNNIIMITSSLSGEGKSYTSFNLAMSIAYEYNYTVLFIDADLIRKTATRMLEQDDKIGLIQYLKDDSIDLSETILSTNIPKLNLIPAGTGEDDLITELFNSHRMESLVSELSRRYNDRIIIIDSPPMMLDSSSRALLKLAKQTLLVIEAEKTPRYVVNDALNILSEMNNVGVILNKSNQNVSNSYGYYYK